MMRQLISRRAVVNAALVIALGALGLSALWLSSGRGAKAPSHEGLRTATIRRGDLQMTLIAGGTIDSSERMLIECEVERMSFSSDGQTLSAGNNLTILKLAPEGSDVAAGDVICELDSSEFIELIEQQLRLVEQARTDFRTAELNVDKAESAVREFTDGLKTQSFQSLEASIALAEGNLETARDRLSWTERMLTFGYSAPAKVAGERLTAQRAEESLRSARRSLEIYRDYEVPKTVLQLEGKVDVARAQRSYQKLRLTRHEDRLRQFQNQVERCTITAPHDGFLVYANEEDDDTRVEEGSLVKTKQDLFYLPDLEKMQVFILVHESIYEGVHPGQPTRVHVAALPGLEITGHVLSVEPLPYRPKDNNSSPDVKNFLAKVELTQSPVGLRPGMSASVEILAGEKPDALLVPTVAVMAEEGKDYCYVAAADRIERREVRVATGNVEFLCVEDGLREGDEVILDTARAMELMAGTASADEPATTAADEPPTAPADAVN